MSSDERFDRILRSAVDLTHGKDDGSLTESHWTELIQRCYAEARYYGGILIHEKRIPYEDRAAYGGLQYLGEWRAGIIKDISGKYSDEKDYWAKNV